MYKPSSHTARLLFAIVIIAAIGSTVCKGKAKSQKSPNKSHNEISNFKGVPKFDHFVYAQQWPQSICIIDNVTHTKMCDLPKNTSTWTVHGLWPTEKDTYNPNYCNKSQPFDTEKVKTLLDRLNQYWPSLYNDGPKHDNVGFWKHEWEKHGTCAVGMPLLKGEYNYFRTALNLNRKYDLLTGLQAVGIKPTNQQTIAYVDFMQAFKKKFKATPLLYCVYDKISKTQYIAQVEMCLDKSKNFKVIECPKSKTLYFRGRSVNPSPCNDAKDLAYPPITHNWSAASSSKKRRR